MEACQIGTGPDTASATAELQVACVGYMLTRL